MSFWRENLNVIEISPNNLTFRKNTPSESKPLRSLSRLSQEVLNNKIWGSLYRGMMGIY